MKAYKYRILFILSIIIGILVLVIGITGLTDDLYAQESHTWQTQCIGQDLINLAMVVPCLMISALLLLNGKLIGKLTWPGVIFYLIYTFAIYCFDVHFNDFFIEYCTVFGLSLYSLIYFLYGDPDEGYFHLSTNRVKTIAIYLLATGLLFYGLWLSQILPAVRSGNLPKGLVDMHLPTNPVHVLDLSVLLPLFLITSLLLFRKKKLGLRLAAGLLTFSVLMDATILVLDMLQENSSVTCIAFTTLGLLSLTLLVSLISQYRTLVENTLEVL